MGSTRVTYCSLAAVLGVLALAGATGAQQGDSNDDRAIRALIEQWNLAVSAGTPEKGVEIAGGVLSDKAYTVVQSNRWTTDPKAMSEALVGNKKVFCELVAQSLRDGPKWGAIKVQQLTIAGPVAYAITEATNPNQDPKSPATWFNVYAKEEVGWRVVFGTPTEDLQKAMRQLDAGKQAQQKDSRDERAIRASFERMNLGMNADTPDKGVEMYQGELSDKGFTFVQPNRWITDPKRTPEAIVTDKKALCSGLAQSLRDGQKWGVHQIQQLTIAGPIAYEIGRNMSPPDAKVPTTWFNVLAREDVGWRVVFCTPAEDFKKAWRQLDAGKGKSAK